MRAREDAPRSRADEAAGAAAAASDQAGVGNPTRRALFRGAAGVGAAGVAAAAMSGLAGRAIARTTTGATAEAGQAARPDGPEAAAEPADQIVVHVKDAVAGHIDVYRGAGLVRVHDPELASRLARISRA